MSGEDDLSDEWLRHITGWALVNARPERLGVAVSGGGDSMALLDLMMWHGRDLGIDVEAVTVDHGLRAEAAEEIAQVRSFCDARAVPHSVLAWSWDGTGNLQAAARDARYRLIADWAIEKGIDTVALGHTKDDVAETFLMRLARRSGVDGLARMEDRFDRLGVRWVRPMMGHGRQEWRVYLRRHGIAWAEDPSNEDDRFDRVKARKVLEALAPLGVDADVLSDVAGNLWHAKSALAATARDAADDALVLNGDLILPPTASVSRGRRARVVPTEIMFRLQRAGLSWVSGQEFPPRAAAMTDLEMTLTKSGRGTLGGCFVSIERGLRQIDDRWRIAREYAAVRDTVSDTETVWDGRWVLKGPHDPKLEVRALGERVSETPWQETRMPRASLKASPAIFDGNTLVAAPVAGLGNGWQASATGRGDFATFLLSR